MPILLISDDYRGGFWLSVSHDGIPRTKPRGLKSTMAISDAEASLPISQLHAMYSMGLIKPWVEAEKP